MRRSMTHEHEKEPLEITTIDGTKVHITLADWTENIIDRSLAKHKLECPVEKYRSERKESIGDLDKRILALELKLKIVHWLIIPFYIGIAGWIVNHFTSIFEMATKVIK